MKVAVIGLGSMGKRRIRLIRQYKKDIEIIGIDLDKTRCIMAEEEFYIETNQNLEVVLERTDVLCAFISTSPMSHAKIIKECLESNIHVFTELNLINIDYEENITLADQNNKVLFLSSTFLYREEVGFIKEKVRNTKSKVNYNYHIGQYLPDWHPWEDYKDFFIGDKRTNGCREILAIELPWLADTFGGITKINSIHDKMTTLDVEYDDNYLILIEHETGCKGALSVNVVSRKAVRNLEVYGEELYIQWDGSPTGLKEYDCVDKAERSINLYDKVEKLENYSSFIIENAYYNEVVNFFESIEGKSIPLYSFEKDKKIIELIDYIEGM